MRAFQVILAVLSILLTVGMFAFNSWISANFSKGLPVPQCYMPMNVITAVLVLITVITIFFRK